MLIDIICLALVVAVAVLTAVDVSRTPPESSHGQADRHARDAERAIPRVPDGIRTFPGEPAASGEAVAAQDSSSPSSRHAGVSSPAGVRQRISTSSGGQHKGSHGALKNWPVRSRLILLLTIAAVTAAVVTVSVIHIANLLQGPSIDSKISSIRDSAITSAILTAVVMIIVLALALWAIIIVTRSVLRPLYKLRTGAAEMAGKRLPDVIRLINEGAGEDLLRDAEPIGVDSQDELGDVARSFDQVHKEVLRLAASEAGLRGKLNTMFVNLSRRSQGLAERQIRIIDDLEQTEERPERLASLFKLDHVTTRMRRYSQNLLVLAGQQLPDSHSNRPVELTDVIRAAVSEVEDYERITLSAQPGIAVAAPAVTDVVHVLAELIENATALSPSSTSVVITGHRLTSGGVLVTITDRGFGMSGEEMAHANWRLDHPAAADVSVSKNMGLFVAARLAARHGVRIRLNPAESGGLTALVWLPDVIVLYQEAAVSPGYYDDYGSARPGPVPAVSDRSGRLGRMEPDHAVAEYSPQGTRPSL
jgi:signal transduction histidine kinase